MKRHPQARLATLARKCATKKQLAAHLKGKELDEAWRIKQVQEKRWQTIGRAIIGNCHYGHRPVGDGHDYSFHTFYLRPQPRGSYDNRRIKPGHRKGRMIWHLASHYGYNFKRRLANSIEVGWTYSWNFKRYSLSLQHTPGRLEVKGSRSADSYTTYYVTLGFDLLRQEAVWIGGLLTIRAKADRRKQSYPCSWLERRKDSPGLILCTGRIERRNHHIEDGSRALKRNLRRCVTTPPKGSGWVCRQTSIDVGNCQSGTDHFIANRIAPYFKERGFTVGDLTSSAFRLSFILSLERSEYTRRLSRQPKPETLAA